ncbi:SGNH hydrolase-type esterase domain-containing protein [Xylariales sp. AK1849]|nr:SGNH hydrolase-type esterase domain-containing protein [Xylariales sp. AK1849]
MAASYDQIVLFGDSLFQGAVDVMDGFSFQAALQALCLRRLDVVNRGFSGWNTEDALKYLPEIFPPPGLHGRSGPRLRYLLVLLGANDACLPHSTPPQRVPLEEYKTNLKAIITHPNIIAHNVKILLVTPPPLDETRIHQFDILEAGLKDLTRKAAISASYSEAARQVAAEVPGTILVDLQKALMDHALKITPDVTDKDFNGKGEPLLGYLEGRRGALGQLLPDGLHMSGEAYRVFFDLVKQDIGPFPGSLDAKGEKSEFFNPFPAWNILAEDREKRKEGGL